MGIIFVCPTCEEENRIEVVGEDVEAASCEHCGTELYLLEKDGHYQAVKS